MAVSLGDVVVRFLGDVSDLHKGVEESTGLLGGFGGLAADVGKRAGEALVEIGVESVKMAGDFQQSLTQLVTGAGESEKNLGMIGDGIKQISVESAMSTKQLTEGMYMVESAGYRGAAGLAVLKASAEGARAGNASLATSAKAVTTVMTDYSSKHYTATQAMNALIATEGAGQAHLEELSRSMGAVLPLASSLGVSFPQVAAGMAVMTNSGMSARQSAQNLASAIRSLAAPNSVAVTSMQAVGLRAQQLKDTLSTQGLSGAIQLVEEHVGKKFPAGSVEAVTAFKNIMGGATGYGVALKLGGDHMKAYEDDIKLIGSALGKNAKDVEGFSEVQKGFNFQLDRAKMAGEALMLTLGQALLPILTKLLEQVTPLMTSFGEWITKSGVLQGVIGQLGQVWKSMMGYLNSEAFAGVVADFQTLGNQIVRMLAPLTDISSSQLPSFETAMATIGSILTGTIIPAIDTFVFNLGQMAIFLNENQLAAQIVGDTLIGIGVAIAAIQIGAFIATIPALVAGFTVWAAAAWAAAAGTIAATWPIIAIGAAIALVVAGIILAIQHWGDITKWAQGVWAGFSSWFMGALGAVGVFFHGVWNGITAFFQQAWGVLVNIGKIGAQVLYLAVFGQFILIGKAFSWLYDHNYYFQRLMDTITGWTKAGLSWLQGAWQATSNWLGNRWSDIARTSATIWGGITRASQAQAAAEGNAIQTAWNATAAFTTRVWNAIATSVSSAWRTISGIIGGAWNTYIAGPLGGLWSRFSGWFGNLATMAVQWGANLLAGFGKGVISSLGSLGTTLSQVAGTVVKFLGFHSPPAEGPAHDADKWAPNLIKMYAGGLVAGVPAIASASTSLIAPLAPRLSPSSSGRQQIAHIHVHLGDKEIVSQLMPMVYDEARAMTGWRPVG